MFRGEPERITSRNNKRLVHARKVRDGIQSDAIFIEGRRLVEEAFNAGLNIKEVFLSDRSADMHHAINARSHARSFLLSENLFATISDTKTPQGIAAVADRPTCPSSLDVWNGGNSRGLVMLLESLQDPANVGSALRSAKAAGVSAVILTRNSADPFTPKALRSSMGAAFGVRLATDADLDETISIARGRGFRIIAASGTGGSIYWDVDWRIPTLLLIGSEGQGLSSAAIEHADLIVKVPMLNGVESLNVAVSCGVIAYEALRQKQIV